MGNTTDYSQVKSFLIFVEIDREVTDLESNKILVENEIVKAENLIQNFKSEISNNNLNLTLLNKKQHSLELELKSINGQEADKKNKLERISNSREFFAVNHELEDLIKKKAVLEAEYLNIWQEVETLENETIQINKNLEVNGSHAINELDNFKRRLLSIESRLRDAITQKDKVIKNVDPDLLSQYLSMKQSTKNPVVKVKRDSCGGCFYLLSAQDLLSIEQHRLIRCKNCYRIIYDAEELTQ